MATSCFYGSEKGVANFKRRFCAAAHEGNKRRHPMGTVRRGFQSPGAG